MSGPIAQNIFGLFSFIVICFCVENLYTVSADSKEDDVPEPPPTDNNPGREFYVAFTIETPYQKDYSNSASQQFQNLAEKIKKALIDVSLAISENPTVTVTNLRKTISPDQVRVIVNVFTIQTKGDELEKAISKQINGLGKLGEFRTINPENFSFNEFGVDPPMCIAGQIKCNDGQCINNGISRRCNKFIDCNDGSDEEGCNYTRPEITLSTKLLNVHPGEDAYINCSAIGDQPIKIFWSRIDGNIPNSVKRRGGYIRFNNIQLQDAGKYLCTARNGIGSDEAEADVIVEGITTSTSTSKTNTNAEPLTTAWPPAVTSTVKETSTTPPATTRKPVNGKVTALFSSAYQLISCFIILLILS